jgi:chemotaxis family two-component system response regulator Rcp1
MKDLEILLVEDSPSDVRLIREAIREAGVSITLSVARDGMEALNYLGNCEQGEARRPHLILLDWHLPRKNGREVLSEIKSSARLCRIPVLVLTSSANDEDIAEAYSLNANSFITKPGDLNSYLRMIRSIDSFWGRTATLPSAPPSFAHHRLSRREPIPA